MLKKKLKDISYRENIPYINLSVVLSLSNFNCAISYYIMEFEIRGTKTLLVLFGYSASSAKELAINLFELVCYASH